MSNLNFLDATPLHLSGRSGTSINGLPYSRRTSMEVFLDGMDDMLNGGDDMNMDSFSLSGMSIDDEPLSSSEIEVHRGPQHIMPSEIMINNDCSSPATHQRTMSTTSLNSHTSLSSAQRPTNYTEQLQSLAASMKRTEESRKHIVKMKREHLTPAQRAALSTATAQLSKQNQQVMSSSSSSSGSSQSPQGNSGFMAQLNGVRRTMGGYLGSVNNQTL